MHQALTSTTRVNPAPWRAALAVLVCVGLVAAPASAQLVPPVAPQVPALINFQGMLTDAEGAPVKPDGEYWVDFRLWNASVGGTLIWGSQYKVTVIDGRFNVVFGSAGGGALSGANSSPETASLRLAFESHNRHLGLTVVKKPNEANANPQATEIAPRQQLLSAPYAMMAAGSVPVGGVIPWYSDAPQPPAGWVLCDGKPINDPESLLNNHNTPDLNEGGRFIRGTDKAGFQAPAGSLNHTTEQVRSDVNLNNHYHLTTIFDYSRDQNPPAWPSAEWIHSGLSMDPLFGATRFGDEGVAYPARGWSYLNTFNQNYPNQPGQFLHHTSTAKGVNLNAHRHEIKNVLPPYVALRYIMRIK